LTATPLASGDLAGGVDSTESPIPDRCEIGVLGVKARRALQPVAKLFALVLHLEDRRAKHLADRLAIWHLKWVPSQREEFRDRSVIRLYVIFL
jgi:hypothetical protein